MLLDYTLSANCHGTDIIPYRVSVELMPTGIATVRCSCPYSGEGDCKHIVALLLTYTRTPETVLSVDTLLTTLETKPKSDLIRVISELLKQVPELAPVAQVYSELLRSPIAKRIPEYTDKLLALLRHHKPDIAINLYQEVIEQAARQRRRENYEKVHRYLMALRSVYCQLDQQDQWCVYLEHLRESHSRKRLLLQLISDLK